MVVGELKKRFGSMGILIGDGATGIAVFTVGEAGTDPDMVAALVYGLEQAIREHSASARDVFFGGLSPQGGLGWCVKNVNVGGEDRELYVGVMLSPGEDYTYDINILYQHEERGWFFSFLKDNLLGKVAEALARRAREEGGLDGFLRSGQKIGGLRKEEALRSVDDMGETYRIILEAYSEFQKARGENVSLDALTRDGRRADGRSVVVEAVQSCLEWLFEFQDKAEGDVVLAPVRGFKHADEAFNHVWLSLAEVCCEFNPAFLFLAGGGKNYLEVWRKALNGALEKWKSKSVDFLIERRFGEDFLVGGSLMVGSDELARVEGVLRRVASELEERLREKYPLVALAFERVGNGVLEELAGYVYVLIQYLQERVFSDFKDKILEDLSEERVRLLYYGLTVDEMKAKVEEYVDECMGEYEDRLYMVSHLLVCQSPTIEKVRRKLRDDVWERVASAIMRGEVPVLLSAVKQVKGLVKDEKAEVFLMVVEEFLKEAGGSVAAALPALGYILEGAGVFDVFTEKVKETCEAVNGSSEIDIDKVVRGLEEKALRLSGSVEDVQRVGNAFIRAVQKVAASWMSRLLMEADGRPPIVRLLYNAYLEIGKKINGAQIAFKILELLVSELVKVRASNVKELADTVKKVYDLIIDDVKKIKVNERVKRELEKVSKKLDVPISSVRQLSSYLAKRRNEIWGWVLGEGDGEVKFVPHVSFDPEEIERFYVRISNTIFNEVSFIEKVLLFLKGVKVDVGDEVKGMLDFLVDEAKKLRSVRAVKRRIEEVLEERKTGTFRQPEAFDEVVETWNVDPFFGGREGFLEAYVGYSFWEDKGIALRLADRVVKRLLGAKDDSELVAKAVEMVKKKVNIIGSALEAISEHFSIFTQFLESQSMRVELSFLSPNTPKLLKKKPDYHDLKIELKKAEDKAASIEVKDGKPFVVLGEITDAYFPRGEQDVEACFKGLGGFKAKRADGGFLLVFELPDFRGGEILKLVNLARAYAWTNFLEKNEVYFKAFKELLGLVSPNAQKELEMFKEFLRFNIFKVELTENAANKEE